MNNRLMASIARIGGGKLLDIAVGRLFADKPRPSIANPAIKPVPPSITRTVAGVTLASVARRSVPAAIIIGGGLLAKTLYDRRKARQEQADAPIPDPDDDAGA
jgi:hypothetical protein